MCPFLQEEIHRAAPQERSAQTAGQDGSAGRSASSIDPGVSTGSRPTLWRQSVSALFSSYEIGAEEVVEVAPHERAESVAAGGDEVALLVNALRYLRAADLPMREISDRLSYSEPSAFFRAVQRWTSMTAQAYRKEDGPVAVEE